MRRLDLIETIPAKKFKEKVRPGMRVQVQGRTGTIENNAGGRVRVNFNAPLAGETLDYEYKIEEIIEGKKEKIAAVVKMYGGKDLEHTYEGETVSIEVPKEFSFNQRWQIIKSVLASQMMEIEGIKNVVFKETYKKEEPAKAEEKKSE
jgi:FKBP-type peptidyl-prolyl cis-trans isomerase SlyD